MRERPAAVSMASPSFLQNAGNIGIFAPFAGANLHQLERHIFREATAILFEAMLHPGGHLGAHRNQLNLHLATLLLSLLRVHLSGTAPQFFQLVEVTMLILHHMHDHRAHIYQHPLAARFTFHAQ